MEKRFESLVMPELLGIKPYKPGKPISELKREKGLEIIYKIASNENPLGPSPKAREALACAGEELHIYPDGFGFELKQTISQVVGIPMENIVLGNGSSEIIEMCVRLFVRPGKKVLLASPSFSIYEIVTIIQGGAVVNVHLKDHKVDLLEIAGKIDADTALVILGNPNNPTGTIFTAQEFEGFLANIPKGVPVLLDEAYAEYATDADFPKGFGYALGERPVIVARTFSKAYGLAALRIGYGVAPAEIVDYMNRLRLPFNANGVAQIAAKAALRDSDHVRKSVSLNSQGREILYKFLSERNIEYVPSSANFVLFKVGDGDGFFARMLDKGIIVRSAAGFGMPEWVRVTIGLPEEMNAFMAAFDEVMQIVRSSK